MKFRVWTVIRFTVDLEVEADSATEAKKKVGAMEPMELIADAGAPEIEVEDCIKVPS
jgi:hypothetical protein